MKRLIILLACFCAAAMAASPMKTSLVSLRRDLSAWQLDFSHRKGDWYVSPLSPGRKAIDKEYALKFDARIDAAVKQLTSANLIPEAGTVSFFKDAAVAPGFKEKLEEFQRFLGELD